MTETNQQGPETPIAIVGIGCEFPAARNLTQFWKLVCTGAPARTANGSVPSHESTSLDSVQAFHAVVAAALQDREAAMQWRRQAIAEARRQRRQSTNASSQNTKTVAVQAPRLNVQSARVEVTVAGTVSWQAVDAPALRNLSGARECKVSPHRTSMQALRATLTALRNADCDMGIVAAVQMPQAMSDAAAVWPGCVALVLKRLADAQRDGERIYAQIRGVELGAESDSELDSELDGAQQSVDQAASAEILVRTYERLGIDPKRIALVECDAGGDAAADVARSELELLGAALTKEGFPSVLLGSAKSIIGDTGAAAGLAGVVKCALALYHRVLPPTFQANRQPHPLLKKSRLYVRPKLSPWIDELEATRFAAINAFEAGTFSGHIILQEPPTDEGVGPQLLTPWSAELIILSGATREALISKLNNVRARLDSLTNADLADLSYTLAQHYVVSDRFRLTMVARTMKDLGMKLARAAQRLSEESTHNWTDQSGVSYGCTPYKGQVGFLFPGVGFPGLSGAYADRIGELALHFPDLRWWLDCAASHCVGDGVPYPLRFQLFPPDYFDPATLAAIEEELKWSQRAAIGTQIANVATHNLMKCFGVIPDAMAGFSLGEWSAIVAAGFISSAGVEEWQNAFAWGSDVDAHLERRGTWAMVSASAADAEAVLRPLGDEISVTLDISASQVFIGGDGEIMSKALALLKQAGIWALPLPMEGPMAAFSAFHTKYASAFSEKMRMSLEALPLRPLECTIYSSVNCRPLPRDPKQIVPIIVENSSKPVRVRETIASMHRDGFRMFIQMGGGGKLLPTVEKILGLEPYVALSIDVEYMTGLEQLLTTLARLTALGQPVQPQSLYQNRVCRELDLGLPKLSSKPGAQPRAPMPPPNRLTGVLGKPAGAPNSPSRNTTPAGPSGTSVAQGLEPAVRASAPAPAKAQVEPIPLPLVGDIQRLIPGQQLESLLCFDLNVHRFLVEHSLLQVPDGLKPARELLPTLPFAFGIEIIAEVAQTLVPELQVVACREVEQAKFIALKSSDTLQLRIRARRTNELEVAVGCAIEGDLKPALRGTVQLGKRMLEPRAPLELQYERACPQDVDWFYGKGPFFHGPLLRVQRALKEMSANSLRGELVSADPRDSFYKPMPSTLFDPVLLDGVAQMLNYRFWLERERFFVPIGVKRISFHQRTLPAGSRVHAQLKFAEVDARRIEGDFDVRDEQGRSILQVEGWREWWVIWPKCFLQTNHLARVAQIASTVSDTPPRTIACSVNQAAFGDLDADFVARLYLTLEEWQQFQERRSVPWLLGRIAAKDAVRGWLRQHRNQLLHPLEVPIMDSPSGAPMTLLPEGEPLQLSISHLEDEASAVVGDHAIAIELLEMRPQDHDALEAQLDADEVNLLPQAHLPQWVQRALAAKHALSKLLSLTDCAHGVLRVQGICEEHGTVDLANVNAPDQLWQVHTNLQKSRVLALASLQEMRQIEPESAEDAPCDGAAQELSQLAWRERQLAQVRMLTLGTASAPQPAHPLIAEAGAEAAATQAGGSLVHV